MRGIARRDFVKLAAATAGLAAFAAIAGYDGRAPWGRVPMAFADELPDALRGYGRLRSSFVVVSDTHISASLPEYTWHLRNALEDAARFCPDADAVVVAGDMTDDGTAESYRLFAATAADAGFSYADDFVLAMGNHDQWFDDAACAEDSVDAAESGEASESGGSGSSNESGSSDDSDGSNEANDFGSASDSVSPSGTDSSDSPSNSAAERAYAYQRELFAQQVGESSVYYDRHVGSAHVIVLGPDLVPETNWVHGNMSADQLAWLDRLLAADEAAGVPSLVFAHEPLRNTLMDTYEGQWGYENTWDNNDELAAVLAGHTNVLFFAGHTHAFPEVVRPSEQGPAYVGTGSVAYGYANPNDSSADASAYTSTGLLVRVYDAAIEVKVRDFLTHAWVDGCDYVQEL